MVEVSRNVVAILLILVIAVSGFGTYSLVARDHFNEASGTPVPSSAGSTVSLQVGEPAGTSGTLELAVAGGQ